MKTIALALALLPALAAADVLTWDPKPVGKGYAGPVVVRVENSDGTARDVSAATGTLRVYRRPPASGVGGALLFTVALSPGGETGTMVATVSAANTATPGSFYAEIDVVDGAVTDAWHSTFVIEGR